jgi:hypothetical protein
MRDMTLQEARDSVREGVKNKTGTRCPCCGKHCKEYKFSVSGVIAESLGRLYRKDLTGTGVHLREFSEPVGGGGTPSVLRYFGLITQTSGSKSKPFNRSGIWSITEKGVNWVCGLITIPKYVYTFDQRVTGYSKQEWTWSEATLSDLGPEDAKQDTHRGEDETIA